MKKAFVVVDYQNDFINGSLGFEKALGIKQAILEELYSIDFDSMHLLFTYDTHDENYLQSKEGRLIPIKHCIKDSFGWQMPTDFTPFLEKAHRIFYKNSFGSLEFANFIAKNAYEELHFCGLVSHICVFCNIILALSASPNSRLIVHKKLTTSFDIHLEQAAFELLRAYGIEVL